MTNLTTYCKKCHLAIHSKSAMAPTTPRKSSKVGNRTRGNTGHEKWSKARIRAKKLREKQNNKWDWAEGPDEDLANIISSIIAFISFIVVAHFSSLGSLGTYWLLFAMLAMFGIVYYKNKVE